MIPSGYQNNGRVLPGTVGQMNDGWLLLENRKGLEHDRQSKKKFFLPFYVYEGFISAVC